MKSWTRLRNSLWNVSVIAVFALSAADATRAVQPASQTQDEESVNRRAVELSTKVPRQMKNRPDDVRSREAITATASQKEVEPPTSGDSDSAKKTAPPRVHLGSGTEKE